MILLLIHPPEFLEIHDAIAIPFQDKEVPEPCDFEPFGVLYSFISVLIHRRTLLPLIP